LPEAGKTKVSHDVGERKEKMNYTFFAIACYIVMRGLQVLFEEKLQARWCRVLIKTVTIIMLYAALASLIVWYKEIPFLGFSPSK
jgi:hypothetical protein